MTFQLFLRPNVEASPWGDTAKRLKRMCTVAVVGVSVGAVTEASSQEAVLGAEELAKKLANPIANLVSVPLQNNWDRNIGPIEAGRRYTLNLQPVIPMGISPDWNLVTRVVLPVIDQSEVFPGAGDQFGLGDTAASLFFSPKEPSSGGWIWGVGPVFLLPTGTDDLLTTKKWGLGPTAVALRQEGPWTYGALANHIWSVAGSSSRPDVNSSFLQPFLSYTTPSAWSFVLQAEATYDWEREDASVPVGVFIGKLFKVGSQPIQIVGGPRYYVSHFDNGPRGWGLRLSVTLLFPK
jgi:hypothetical protein